MQVREIDTHKVDGVRSPELYADGKTSPGGAPVEYTAKGDSFISCILFQDGPVPEHGVNGLTNEVLLAIVIDRLEGFQSGPFPCDANADAIQYCKGALGILKSRTMERLARSVEGKHEA